MERVCFDLAIAPIFGVLAELSMLTSPDFARKKGSRMGWTLWYRSLFLGKLADLKRKSRTFVLVVRQGIVWFRAWRHLLQQNPAEM